MKNKMTEIEKDSWKSPANIIALIGLIVSIIANIYQYLSTEKKVESERSELTEKYNKEIEKLNIEIENLENKFSRTSKYQAELDTINKNIKYFEDIIFQDNIKIQKMRLELNMITSSFKKEALEKNIKLMDELLKKQNDELTKNLNRRKELETLINN